MKVPDLTCQIQQSPIVWEALCVLPRDLRLRYGSRRQDGSLFEETFTRKNLGLEILERLVVVIVEQKFVEKKP